MRLYWVTPYIYTEWPHTFILSDPIHLYWVTPYIYTEWPHTFILSDPIRLYWVTPYIYNRALTYYLAWFGLNPSPNPPVQKLLFSEILGLQSDHVIYILCPWKHNAWLSCFPHLTDLLLPPCYSGIIEEYDLLIHLCWVYL